MKMSILQAKILASPTSSENMCRKALNPAALTSLEVDSNANVKLLRKGKEWEKIQGKALNPAALTSLEVDSNANINL